MSTIKNGNDIGLYVNNQLIGCLTTNGFNSKNNEIDVTCKDNNGAKQVLPAGNEWSMPFQGNYTPAAGYGFKDLLGVHKNKTRVGVKTTDSDGFYITGYAYLNTLDFTGPVNAATTFSGEFTGDGPYNTHDAT